MIWIFCVVRNLFFFFVENGTIPKKKDPLSHSSNSLPRSKSLAKAGSGGFSGHQRTPSYTGVSNFSAPRVPSSATPKVGH